MVEKLNELKASASQRMEHCWKASRNECKKIASPTDRGIIKNNVALTDSDAYVYNIADFLENVKGVFDNTCSRDVYEKLGMTRRLEQKKKPSLLQNSGHQLSGFLPQDGFVHSIHDNGSKVNAKYKNNIVLLEQKRSHPCYRSPVTNCPESRRKMASFIVYTIPAQKSTQN